MLRSCSMLSSTSASTSNPTCGCSIACRHHVCPGAPIPPPEGEVAAAEPPPARRSGSPCQITSNPRAEPLTEGVEAIQCESRSDAATVRGSWNRLTPSAAWRRHLPLKTRGAIDGLWRRRSATSAAQRASEGPIGRDRASKLRSKSERSPRKPLSPILPHLLRGRNSKRGRCRGGRLAV